MTGNLLFKPLTAQTLDAFQVIADPSCRKIMQLLSKDSMTINALAKNFDMSRPAVSKHIKILYGAGFSASEAIKRIKNGANIEVEKCSANSIKVGRDYVQKTGWKLISPDEP